MNREPEAVCHFRRSLTKIRPCSLVSVFSCLFLSCEVFYQYYQCPRILPAIDYCFTRKCVAFKVYEDSRLLQPAIQSLAKEKVSPFGALIVIYKKEMKKYNTSNRRLLIVQSQFVSLCTYPFHLPGQLRKSFKAIFENKQCFSKNPDWVFEKREQRKSRFDSNIKSFTSAPFIKNIGQICFNVRSVNYRPSKNSDLRVCGNEWRAMLQNQPGYVRKKNTFLYDFDRSLDDERMNCLYFEMRPSFCISGYLGGHKTYGRVFLHIYPSGYLYIQFVFSVSQNLVREPFDSTGEKTAKLFKYIVDDSLPTSKNNNKLWKCKLGELSLYEIKNHILDYLSQSLYKENSPEINSDDEWEFSLLADTSTRKILSKIENSFFEKVFYKECQSKFLLHRKYYTYGKQNHWHCYEGVIEDRFYSIQGAHVYIPSNDSKICLHMFWKCMAINEFVLYRDKIAEDYIRFLSDTIEKLREARLQKSKFFAKCMERIKDTFDSNVSSFIDFLDYRIKKTTPFYRALYSHLSFNSRLEKRRVQLLKLKDAWIKEIDANKNSKDIVDHIMDLLGLVMGGLGVGK